MTKMQFSTSMDLLLTEEGFEYLERSARIRKTSRSRLVQRLLETIMEEQLVLATLDDDSKPEPIVAKRGKYRAVRRMSV